MIHSQTGNHRPLPLSSLYPQSQRAPLCLLYFFNIYLFRLCRILIAAVGIIVTACRIFSCGVRDLLVASCELLVTARMWNLVPRPGIEPRPPELGVQRLTHWTTREVPVPPFKLALYQYVSASHGTLTIQSGQLKIKQCHGQSTLICEYLR